MGLASVEKRKTLSREQLEAIDRLAEICNEYEGIDIKLNREMLRERSGQETNDFLYYADGQLVGFLGIYQFRASEAELSGMVHPDYRRQGVFKQLLQAARPELKGRGAPKLIFMSQHRSSSGKDSLQQLGAEYSFSEYWMEMSGSASGGVSAGVRDTASPNIRLRKGRVHDDLELLVDLNMDGFAMNESDARNFAVQDRNADTYEIWIAELLGEHGEGQAIGKLHVHRESGESAFIYGFSVRAAHRGKGYGRAILQSTIEALRERGHEGRIALEVAVENERALGLYESCGFRVKSANDYYVLAGPEALPDAASAAESEKRADAQASGTVRAVSLSEAHSFSKQSYPSIRLLAGMGVEGDAHMGVTVKHRSRVARDPSQPNLRQVHLIHSELFEELEAKGFHVAPGEMGENITTHGIALLGLPTGTRLYLGDTAVVEVTGLRNPCPQLDRFQSGLKDALLGEDTEGRIVRKAGVMGIVIEGGEVRPGDPIRVALPEGPHLPLERV